MKAIALFSGGLDSTLAMAIAIEQGIEVIGLNVNIGFGSTRSRREHMEKMCKQVGAEFLEIDIRSQYLRDILFTPKYGYGKNFNPCIDCHGNMFRVAKNMMKELGASFLISGEVAGQRPMSQNLDALYKVVNLAETEDLLVRPLSAKILDETTPEKNGWINRDMLFGIMGRGREVQMSLVKKYNLVDFESPGGGCLLTDANFSNKIRDFIEFDKLEVDDIDVLKFGRHFRLKDGAKLVIGRNKEDNDGLRNIKSQKFVSLEAKGVSSPFCLISVDASEDDLEFAFKSVLTYTKAVFNTDYIVLRNDSEEFFARPFGDREICREWSL